MGVANKAIGLIPTRYFVPLIAWQYRLAEPELRHLDRFVPKDLGAVDVGVWWGPWSWWLARRSVRLHSFEPIAELCSNVASVMPPNVTLHNVALSDRSGTAEIWIPSGGMGTEGRSSIEPSWQPATGGRYETVPTECLDAFELKDIGFVKIDVEGHEMAVLRGAETLLATERPNIMIEIEQHGNDADHMSQIVELLGRHGYRGSFLRSGTWVPLSEFDPVGAQEMAQRAARSGYVKNLLLYARRHVHNFLFTAD
jgi:FkbM family methyltransferase